MRELGATVVALDFHGHGASSHRPPHAGFGYSFEDHACAVVGVLLAENKTVKTLKLSRTGLGSVVQAEGGGVIFDPLVGGESTLRVLDLSDMELGDTGGRKIFEALIAGRCKRITSLVLSIRTGAEKFHFHNPDDDKH